MQSKECLSYKLVITLGSPATPSLLMAVHKVLMSSSVQYGRLLMLWKSGLVVNNVMQDIIFEVDLESMSSLLLYTEILYACKDALL